MVTHNPELAYQYANRIVQLKDGQLVDDSNPYEISQAERIALEDRSLGASPRTSMNLATAFSLSLNNLFTKKGRTLLTAFAGSIGIIGIALILSLSSGAQDYIKDMEESTMGSYPLTIQTSTMDLTSLMGAMMGTMADDSSASEEGVVQSKDVITGMVTSMANDTTENDMESIKEWLDSNPDNLQDYVTDIQYSYKTPLNVYRETDDGSYVQVNPTTVMDALGFSTSGSVQTEMLGSMSALGSGYDVWTALLSNQESVQRDYDLVNGSYPQAWNEVVVCLDSDGNISDYTLYSLGLKDQDELRDMMSDALAGKKLDDPEPVEYTYDELMGLTFKLVPQSAYYEEQDDGTWADMSEDADYVDEIAAAGDGIKVVGIVKPSEDSLASSTNAMYGGVLYTNALMEHLIEQVNESEVVKAQRDDSNTDIFTGYAFPAEDEEDLTMDGIQEIGRPRMPAAQGEQIQAYIDQMRDQGMSDDEGS